MATNNGGKEREGSNFPFEVAIVEPGSPEEKLYRVIIAQSGIIGYEEDLPYDQAKGFSPVSIRVVNDRNVSIVRRRADVIGNTPEFVVVSAAHRGEDSMTVEKLTALFGDESWARRIKAYAVAQQMIRSFSREYLVGLNGPDVCDKAHEDIACLVGERPLGSDLYRLVVLTYIKHEYDKGME